MINSATTIRFAGTNGTRLALRRSTCEGQPRILYIILPVACLPVMPQIWSPHYCRQLATGQRYLLLDISVEALIKLAAYRGEQLFFW